MIVTLPVELLVPVPPTYRAFWNVSVTAVVLVVVLLMVSVPSTRRKSVHVSWIGPVIVRLPVT